MAGGTKTSNRIVAGQNPGLDAYVAGSMLNGSESFSGGAAGLRGIDWSGGASGPRTGDGSQNVDNGYPGYGYAWGYGGGGYGGGGGGASSGPSDQQKDTFDALGGVKGYEAGDILIDIHDKANQVYDNADEGSRNVMLYQKDQAMNKAGAEWFSNLLKQQSTTTHLKDVMGNARNGSAYLSLTSDMSRYYDAIASQVLENLEDNFSDINIEFAKALNNSINGSNENLMDTLGKLRQGYADYVTQGLNIHPDLVNGKEDGYDDLIDEDNHTLKEPPEWLVPKNYWEDNFRKAVDVDRFKHLRPDAATQDSWNKGLNRQDSNLAGAANKRYWQALSSYSQRSK